MMKLLLFPPVIIIFIVRLLVAFIVVPLYWFLFDLHVGPIKLRHLHLVGIKAPNRKHVFSLSSHHYWGWILWIISWPIVLSLLCLEYYWRGSLKPLNFSVARYFMINWRWLDVAQGRSLLIELFWHLVTHDITNIDCLKGCLLEGILLAQMLLVNGIHLSITLIAIFEIFKFTWRAIILILLWVSPFDMRLRYRLCCAKNIFLVS